MKKMVSDKATSLVILSSLNGFRIGSGHGFPYFSNVKSTTDFFIFRNYVSEIRIVNASLKVVLKSVPYKFTTNV